MSRRLIEQQLRLWSGFLAACYRSSVRRCPSFGFTEADLAAAIPQVQKGTY
jgi:hypothetical protein